MTISQKPTLQARKIHLILIYCPFFYTQSTLASVHSQFLINVEALSEFWSVLDEIDEQTWVLEPEKPTKADSMRRIAIGNITFILLHLNLIICRSPPSIQLCPSTIIFRDFKLPYRCSSPGNNVSIKVQIDPRHPKMLPECCLLGAEHGRHFSYLQISLFISIQLLLRFPACERQLGCEELVPPSRALVFQLPPYISAHAVNALLHLDRTATTGAAELTARNMFAAQCAFRFQ